MKLSEKDAILREIVKINPKISSPDIIQSYKDIVKTRGYFRYYNFHPQVFESLFTIGYQKFFSNERYNKEYLFDIIRLHYKKHPKNYTHPPKLLDKILLFFKGTMLSDNLQAKMCARALIRNQILPDDFIDWLSKNYAISEELKTTLLRYPIPNPKIYNWVNENFEDENLRSRRAELIAIKLNQDKSFVVSARTIINDIEYYIQEDINAYKKFINHTIQDFENIESFIGNRPSYYEELAESLYNHQKSYGMLPSVNPEIYDRSTIGQQIDEIEAFFRKHKIENFFSSYSYRYKNYRVFESFDNHDLKFYELFPKMLFMHRYVLAKRMIYGIYYSNLPKRTKERLIKKYITDKTIFIIERIAIKMKSTHLLKWLLKDEFKSFPVPRFKERRKFRVKKLD